MLANTTTITPCVGTLNKTVQRPDTFRHELINMIAQELPVWRDRADRTKETAETPLTSQVCAHLNSACRRRDGWDILQFRVEEADEQNRGRKIDLVASPAACSILIEGRSYVDFDSLMPIECKRLPTPKESGRDEREYVISEKTSTGGIQRFKAGNHGAQHSFGAMIGYVQDGNAAQWDKRIAAWIDDLAGRDGWSKDDNLKMEDTDAYRRVTTLRSRHQRSNSLPDIELRHVWIEMN
jgi:hypothetical protein